MEIFLRGEASHCSDKARARLLEGRRGELMTESMKVLWKCLEEGRRVSESKHRTSFELGGIRERWVL